MENSNLNFMRSLAMLFVVCAVIAACASRGVTSAEEYYALGMAYFEMGQNAKNDAQREKNFSDAEKWLNRARAIDKTKSASQYNLGRIAFETGRYDEAAKHFEGILRRDKNNVMALQAACYTRIKMGDIAKAESHYEVLLRLVPESADDGYNYALVLFAMEKYSDAQRVLDNYQFALLDNNDTMLLYARILKAQDKIESMNYYARWFSVNKDSKDARVRLEYAEVLESQEFYARALEECRTALADIAADSTNPKKSDLRFAIARILLISNGDSDEGVKELEGAVEDGFEDFDAMEYLAGGKISAANRDAIFTIISNLRRAQSEAQTAKSETTVSSEENVESSPDSSDE